MFAQSEKSLGILFLEFVKNNDFLMEDDRF